MRRSIVILLGLFATAPSLADSDVEHARYSVVTSLDDIEIRDYAPQIVAETTVAGERDAAISQGFRRLAGYIFGDNQPGGKIAMTAPVVQEKGAKISMTAPVAQERSEDGWRIRFTMPAQYDMAALPRPNNPEVRLVQVPGKRMAAIRFSGLVSDDDLALNAAKLADFLKKNRLVAQSGPLYAFYDPPWTLPFNRRNEVMVEILR